MINDVACSDRGLILGYTALTERVIAKGVARLAEALAPSGARERFAVAAPRERVFP